MFHVSEIFRIQTGRLASSMANGNNGAFRIPPKSTPGHRERRKRELWCVASDGLDWEHVSVHAYDPEANKTLTPLWDEMCYIKDLFWEGEDVVMQLHPRESEYVNNHGNVLHLWRPSRAQIPTPPAEMVGIKEVGEIKRG